MTLSCFPYIGSVWCADSHLSWYSTPERQRDGTLRSTAQPTWPFTSSPVWRSLTSSCIRYTHTHTVGPVGYTQKPLASRPKSWVIRSNYRDSYKQRENNNIMDELVMMRSVGVGSSSGGNSMITSVRSLPEKPRRTGKKLCCVLSVDCVKTIFDSKLALLGFLGDRLLDIPCKVCGDRSSGKHYGIFSCDGKSPLNILLSFVFNFWKMNK